MPLFSSWVDVQKDFYIEARDSRQDWETTHLLQESTPKKKPSSLIQKLLERAFENQE